MEKELKKSTQDTAKVLKVNERLSTLKEKQNYGGKILLGNIFFNAHDQISKKSRIY